MKNRQKLAVAFYHAKIKNIMGNWTPMMIQIFEETFEQAKAMEKEQIEKAFSHGQETPLNHPIVPHYSGEEYYNETYKTK